MVKVADPVTSTDASREGGNGSGMPTRQAHTFWERPKFDVAQRVEASDTGPIELSLENLRTRRALTDLQWEVPSDEFGAYCRRIGWDSETLLPLKNTAPLKNTVSDGPPDLTHESFSGK